jgi:hypothetical protein
MKMLAGAEMRSFRLVTDGVRAGCRADALNRVGQLDVTPDRRFSFSFLVGERPASTTSIGSVATAPSDARFNAARFAGVSFEGMAPGEDLFLLYYK